MKLALKTISILIFYVVFVFSMAFLDYQVFGPMVVSANDINRCEELKLHHAWVVVSDTVKTRTCLNCGLIQVFRIVREWVDKPVIVEQVDNE